jgi:hypothetical protein
MQSADRSRQTIDFTPKARGWAKGAIQSGHLRVIFSTAKGAYRPFVTIL